MVDYPDFEARAQAVRDAKATEHAIVLCDGGVNNAGVIYKILAESEYVAPNAGAGAYEHRAGGAERSIPLVFSVSESAEIFAFIKTIMERKLGALHAQLGMS